MPYLILSGVLADVAGTGVEGVVDEVVAGYGPRVPLRVSLNGQDFTQEELLFEYHEPLVLGTIDPTYGPAAGGSRVVVTLAFTDWRDPVPYTFEEDSLDIRCRFNRTVVPAIEIYNTSVVCVSPATVLAGGVVAVDVSVNGGAEFTFESLPFTYTPETAALSVTPRFGPTTGGTLVTIAGQGIPMVPTSQAACMFGADVVPAVGNGVGFVRCRSPATPAPATIPVEITLNGQDFSTYGLRYHYEWPVSVAAISPQRGPVEGGTPVAVTGGRFRNESSDQLRCRFGDQESPALYHSDSLVGCSAPPLRSVDEIQTLSLYTRTHDPEVQTVTLKAADYVEELFVIRTFSNLRMQPEVQEVTTSVNPVDEIQTVSAGTDHLYKLV
jgi:hypothetical protein